jgi:tubulin polyglutamylase TTLL6/13
MNVGHKRSLTSVYEYLEKEGYDVAQLKERINDMFIKTFISGQPVLSNTYKSCQPNNFSNNMCFELLGLDVIIDSKFNPILLEVRY